MIFLIRYNRKKGKIITIHNYLDTNKQIAEKERLDLELLQNRNGIDDEIVLLEANNENDLRQTHRRYFENINEIKSPESINSSYP
jgi:hypothetical protein